MRDDQPVSWTICSMANKSAFRSPHLVGQHAYRSDECMTPVHLHSPTRIHSPRGFLVDESYCEGRGQLGSCGGRGGVKFQALRRAGHDGVGP